MSRFNTVALVLMLLGTGVAHATEDSPQAALDRLVAALKKGDLVAAYQQLTGDARAFIDKELAPMKRRMGLDDSAQAIDIVKSLQAQLSGDARATGMFQTVGAEVLKIKTTGDTARAEVKFGPKDEPKKIVFVFAHKNDMWSISGFDLTKARSASNEAAAIATLRNVVSAQAQFQATGIADANQNGVGEYGTFGELSGAAKVRGNALLNPPVLSTAFRHVKNGIVTRGGYHFHIFLVDGNGAPVGEEAGLDKVDAKGAELVWCCYAWPIEYGKTGKRTFFVNQMGDVLTVHHARYTGAKGPAGNAAFAKTGKGRIDGDTALAGTSNDGLAWKFLR